MDLAFHFTKACFSYSRRDLKLNNILQDVLLLVYALNTRHTNPMIQTKNNDMITHFNLPVVIVPRPVRATVVVDYHVTAYEYDYLAKKWR